MQNERANTILIGKDIPWKNFEHHNFRVQLFSPLSRIEQGKITDPIKYMPYATITVYDPDFVTNDKELILPVVHRLDFQHLWEAYKERGISPEEEVIVRYEPRTGIYGLFGKTLPHLLIRIGCVP